jgi:hypothetical protein
LAIFFSILVLAFVVLAFANEYYQQKMGVSPMPTMPRVRREMVGLIPANAHGTIVELGSGWGGIAFAAARAHPETQVIGVEYSIFPHLMARARKQFNPALKNLKFVRENFFDLSLKDASVVLCYLCNPLMAKLAPKFKNELPANATVISSTFFIPDWETDKIVDIKGLWSTRIFVYKKRAA